MFIELVRKYLVVLDVLIYSGIILFFNYKIIWLNYS